MGDKTKQQKETEKAAVVEPLSPEAQRAKMIAAIHANNTAMSNAFRAGIRKGAKDGNA